MATSEIERDAAAKGSESSGVDMRLEVVVIPVSDVDRAKAFYTRLGWRLDADFASSDDWRVIQFTPPGSACSVIFGRNVTAAAPGSVRGLYLVVSDLEAARQDLLDRGIEVSAPFHGAGDIHAGHDEPYLSGSVRVNGADPKRGSYSSFAAFSDPDGNGWLFQEITTRLPGRRHDIRFAGCAGRGTAPRGGGPWRARKADRRARRELGRLVRRLCRPRTGRRAAPVLSWSERSSWLGRHGAR